MLYALTGEYIFGEAGTMCVKLRWEMSVLGFFRFRVILDFRPAYNLPYLLLLLLISSSASSSPDELVQQLELQIMIQDVIQN